MDRSFKNSNSDLIEQFIVNIIDTDRGFGELPYDILVAFANEIEEQFTFLPSPTDDNWEEIMELASARLIYDPLIDNLEDF